MYSKVAADAEKSKNSSKKRLSPLTGSEQRRFDELEEELPLQAMVMFRAMARKEVRSRFLLLVPAGCCAYRPHGLPKCCHGSFVPMFC